MNISCGEKNGVKVFLLDGKINDESYQEVMTKITDTFKTETVYFCVDFSKVTYINTLGLSSLIKILKASQEKKKILFFVSPSEFVSELLKITNLAKYFKLFEDLDEALKTLKPGKPKS